MSYVGYIGGGSSSSATPVDPIVNDYLKCEICCAYDMNKIYTWTFVNGVRKVFRIQMSSVFVNTKHGVNAHINRDFSYQVVYPFDLISIIDTLILV
jgi:hypothetical protein